MNDKTKYALSGSVTGIINGFFGAGGGLLLVPLLSRFVRLPPKQAFATSVFMIFPMSVVSGIVYTLNGAVDFSSSWYYFLGGFIGGLLGGCFLKRLPALWIRRAFSLMLVYGGIRSLFFR